MWPESKIRQFSIAAFAYVLLGAGLAEKLGVGVTLGALIWGMMLVRTGAADLVRNDIAPFAFGFGSLFLLSVGVELNIALLGTYLPRILLLSVCVVAIKMLASVLPLSLLRSGPRVTWCASSYLAGIGTPAVLISRIAYDHQVISPHVFTFIVGLSALSFGWIPGLVVLTSRLTRSFGEPN